MKFESKFGVKEIVTRSISKHGSLLADECFEVICVVFDRDGSTGYTCRRPNGDPVAFMESELVGDPEFNQDEGKYPEGAITYE